jgi:predicted nucleotidyltransferase
MAKPIASHSPTPSAALEGVIRRICDKYPIARVEIFGPAAGSASPFQGELDLLVDFLPNSEPSLVEMGALREDLEQQLGCRIELVSRRAVESSLNSYRRRSILDHSHTLYAR